MLTIASSTRAAPISTLIRPSGSTVTCFRPAAVSTRSSGPGRTPASTTARARQRRPLPLVSASLPSAFQSCLLTQALGLLHQTGVEVLVEPVGDALRDDRAWEPDTRHAEARRRMRPESGAVGRERPSAPDRHLEGTDDPAPVGRLDPRRGQRV